MLSYKVRRFLLFDAKRFEIKTGIIHYHMQIYIKDFILIKQHLLILRTF